MMVAATGNDGSVAYYKVPERLARLLPTLSNLLGDLGDEDADATVPINVGCTSVELLLSAASGLELPDKWSAEDRKALCTSEPFPACLKTLFAKLKGHDLKRLLSDLDFLGGGFFYDHACRYVAMRITEDHWTTDETRAMLGDVQ